MQLSPEQLAELVAEAVEAATAPLHSRLLVVERQKSVDPPKGEQGERGKDGKDADITLIMECRREIDALRSELAQAKSVPSWLIDDSGELVAVQHGLVQKLGRVRGHDAAPVVVDVEAIARKAASLVPVPKNGTDAAPVDLEALALKAAALIEKPKNGTDAPPVDLEALAKRAAALVPEPSDGKDGQNGRDVELGTVQLLVDAAITKAMAGIRSGEDGTSVTVADVEPLIRAEVAKAVAQLPAAKDGAAGPKGDPGASILVGVGAPASDGKSGDVYLDQASGAIYQWR